MVHDGAGVLYINDSKFSLGMASYAVCDRCPIPLVERGISAFYRYTEAMSGICNLGTGDLGPLSAFSSGPAVCWMRTLKWRFAFRYSALLASAALSL